MKKDSFEKKLAGYVAMATAYLAAHPVDANAQIHYTDVNPDLVIENSFFNLDLNNDGVVDFKLVNSHGEQTNSSTSFFSHSAWRNAEINVLNINDNVLDYSSCPVYPLNFGQFINNADQFGQGGALADNFSQSGWSGTGGGYSMSLVSGCFNTTEKYIGLRLKLNNNFYYGWARVSLNAPFNTIVLKDYAVNLTPNAQIQAGVYNGACPKPINLQTTNITNHSAKLNWNTQSQAIGYTVQYRKTGTSGWLFQYVTTNLGYKNISGLLPNTSYEWRVRTICHQNPLVQSQFTAIQTFTTPLRLEDETVEASVTETQNELFIYPNPAGNEIHLLIGEGGDYELKIFNMLGQQVAVEKINLQQDESVTVSTSNLPSGTYQILVTSNEGNFVGRFVKE